MNIIIIGGIMVIIPLIITLCVLTGVLLYEIINDAKEAYKEKDITSAIGLLFIVSVIVGVIFMCIGMIWGETL